MQRHMPIGYKMINGKIEIEADKSKIVKTIFNEYLAGNSMLSIANLLIEKEILNANNNVNWTHCSVGKILQNVKYMGDEFYPPLIDEKAFQEVQERRKQVEKQLGRTAQVNNMKNQTVFSNKIRCGECGELYRKYIEHAGKPSEKSIWKCKKYIFKNRVLCRNLFHTEIELKTIFISVVNELLKSKLLLKKAPPKEPPKSSYQLRQIENRIKVLEEQEEFSSDELAKLIFKRAEIVYNNSKIYDYESKTEKTKEAFADKQAITEFDEALFEDIIKQIIVFKDSTVKIEFINGITIERNGQNGSSKKNGGNYTTTNSI